VQYPVVIFAYKRPMLLKKCLESLELCDNAKNYKIHIYIDGPQNNTDLLLIEETSRVASKQWAFKQVVIINRNMNLGLRQSIKEGLNEVFDKYDAAIIIEDDLQFHPKFLSFVSNGLEKYRNEKTVASIQGFSLIEQNSSESYFLPGADCWGWGTWSDRWGTVSWDSKYLLNQIVSQKLERQFNFNNSYNFTKLLRLNSEGKISSWAIDWHASMFLQARLSLYPPFNLVLNSGGGKTASNTTGALDFLPRVSKREIWTYPVTIKVQASTLREVCKAYFMLFTGNNIFRKISKKLKLMTYKYTSLNLF
jgi:hypothetical protein